MEWKTVKLGEVCNIRRGASPRPIQEFLSSQGMPWIKISDATATDSKYIDKTKEFIIEEGVSHSVLIEPGTLIVSNSATPGLPKISRITACVHDGWLVIDNFRGILKDFLYYKFIEIRSLLGNQANGSVFMNLKTDIVKEFLIHIPDIEKQRKIVSILSSLDDKIENNNRINRNLEAQAQALFKSWFVDFEPWGGIMPEDWKEGTLGEIAEFKRGKSILGKDARPGNVPVVAGGMEPAYYHDTANTKAPVITISASGANAGYVRLYNEDIWASDCSWIDASSKNLLWVYCYLSINRHILRHAQTGAVQPHVKAKDVNAFEIIVPAQKVIEDFIKVVKPLFDQIANNQKESHRLAALRDTLLPKLMKGEITL